MFRATVCTSSGETTVFMRHLVLFILYGWLSGIPLAHRTVIHQQHVQKRNKRTKKNCAPSWLYLQDCTNIHVQQNVKKTAMIFVVCGNKEWGSSSSSSSSKHYLDIHFCTLTLVRTGLLLVVIIKQPKEIACWRRLRKERRKRRYRLKRDGNKEWNRGKVEDK